ncbi:diguanylate cyclase [Desulfuromonas sp. AOP6]|uniref:diguanylate cyclase n=1 Tax=Desulfuromonas sp. AOP6 TaxID=1566351 RepID=UPI00128725AD|nr:diguanylate cyclase [Desulfuromonas sp. AOP6]BCA78952.1 diguanylate cyclase response regulator [Desulfuromonas sp. AOP6]
MNSSILIVDDSPTLRQEIIHILRKTSLFKFYYEAGDGIEGFKVALNKPVDIILCDLEMPGMDGFKFLSMMGTRDELQDIPVIMLTGREGQETKVQALEQGASDYVTKPFDPAELIARVKVQVKIKSLQDSLKKSNEMLLRLSNTDPLTQLYNRRFLTDALEREMNRSTRNNSPVTLVMLDIDHFKKVNDTYGHQRGDLILKVVADLLMSKMREYDLAARFGGEEFALVLPETTLKQGVEAAERLRLACSELLFPDELSELELTISLGVAAFPHPDIHTLDDLIREADYALYRAKRTGRNRVSVHGDCPSPQADVASV